MNDAILPLVRLIFLAVSIVHIGFAGLIYQIDDNRALC